MTFVWPGMLALLAAIPLLIVVYALSQRRRRPVAARYSSLTLIHAARPGSSRLRRHLPFALFAVAVASLVVALGRPAVVLSVPADGTTVILAMDVSGSMCSTDITPTRLEVAKEAAARFVTGQVQRTHVGIVAFSGLAAMVQAPTDEPDTVTAAIHSLTTGPRTAIGSGILVSIDAIAERHPDVPRSLVQGRPGVAPRPVLPGEFAPAIVVVLTDGASNSGVDPLEAAAQAADRGIRVYTIGYGTATGGPMDAVCRRQFMGEGPAGSVPVYRSGSGSIYRRSIDEATLIEVASLTGGAYYPAGSADELSQVFDELPASRITHHEAVEVSVAFVGLGALLCGVSLLLGRAWRPLP